MTAAVVQMQSSGNRDVSLAVAAISTTKIQNAARVVATQRNSPIILVALRGRAPRWREKASGYWNCAGR